MSYTTFHPERKRLLDFERSQGSEKALVTLQSQYDFYDEIERLEGLIAGFILSSKPDDEKVGELRKAGMGRIAALEDAGEDLLKKCAHKDNLIHEAKAEVTVLRERAESDAGLLDRRLQGLAEQDGIIGKLGDELKAALAEVSNGEAALALAIVNKDKAEDRERLCRVEIDKLLHQQINQAHLRMEQDYREQEDDTTLPTDEKL